MLLVIHNLPSNSKYADIKALIQTKCGLTNVILDNLVSEGLKKRVTVGLADDGDAAILVRKINGLFVAGQQLYVEDVRKKQESEQPYRTSQNILAQHNIYQAPAAMAVQPVQDTMKMMMNYNMAMTAASTLYSMPMQTFQAPAQNSYMGHGNQQQMLALNPQVAELQEPHKFDSGADRVDHNRRQNIKSQDNRQNNRGQDKRQVNRGQEDRRQNNRGSNKQPQNIRGFEGRIDGRRESPARGLKGLESRWIDTPVEDQWESRDQGFGRDGFQDQESRPQDIYDPYEEDLHDRYQENDNSGYGQAETTFDEPNPGFDQRGSRFDQSGSKFDQPGSRFDQFSSRYNQSGSRFDQSGSRFDQPGSRFDQPASRFNQSGATRFDEPVASRFHQPMASRFDQPVASRFDQPVASRFDQPASRFDQPASRFDQPASRFDQPASRFNQPGALDVPVSRFDQQPSSFDPPVSRFDKGLSRFDEAASRFDRPHSEFDQPTFNTPAPKFDPPTSRFDKLAPVWKQPESKVPQPLLADKQHSNIFLQSCLEFDQRASRANRRKEDQSSRGGRNLPPREISRQQPRNADRDNSRPTQRSASSRDESRVPAKRPTKYENEPQAKRFASAGDQRDATKREPTKPPSRADSKVAPPTSHFKPEDSLEKRIRRDDTWRGQTAASLAKQMLRSRPIKSKELIHLKKCIRARIDMILGDRIDKPPELIIKMYCSKFPRSGHEAFLKTVLEEFRKQERLAEEREVLSAFQGKKPASSVNPASKTDEKRSDHKPKTEPGKLTPNASSQKAPAVNTKTEPAKTKTEPSKTNTEPSKTNSEPSKTKTEPVKSKTEPAKTKTEPVKAKTEETKPKPVMATDASKANQAAKKQTNQAGKAPGPMKNEPSTRLLPKFAAGDKKANSRKKFEERKNWQEENFVLPPEQKKALDSEVDIMCDIFMAACMNPDHEKEKPVCEEIADVVSDEFRKVLRVHVSKRLLHVYDNLIVRVHCAAPPPRPALERHLASLGCIALQKSDRHGGLFMAHFDSYENYDKIVALGTAVIDGRTLSFKPFQVCGPPPSAKVIREKAKVGRSKFIRSQVEPTEINILQPGFIYDPKAEREKDGNTSNPQKTNKQDDTKKMNQDVLPDENWDDVNAEIIDDENFEDFVVDDDDSSGEHGNNAEIPCVDLTNDNVDEDDLEDY